MGFEQNLIDMHEFEYVGFKYSDPGLTSRTNLHKRMNKWRVYYFLPSGVHAYFNKVPSLNTKKEKDIYIWQFKKLLNEGYLPRHGAFQLRRMNFDQKDGTFDIYLNNYFEKYATGFRQKTNQSIKSQKSFLVRILNYFKQEGLSSIQEITDEQLKDWDRFITNSWITKKGLKVSGATKNGARKLLRAFLNTAIENGYSMRCDPTKMNIYEYKKGEIDSSADVRSVIYPIELVEKLQISSFRQNLKEEPDMKKIIKLNSELGLRPGELFTLSEKNIVFEEGVPRFIKIMDLPCHSGNKMGFTPKRKVSYREISLSDFASEFIEEVLKSNFNKKRFGLIGKKLYEFPYLFTFWSEKYNAFVRDDELFIQKFKELTQSTCLEFGLSYDEDFVIYDLRRTANFYIKTELNFSDEDAASYLGHSVQTNRKHYTLDKDKIFISNKRQTSAIFSACKNSSLIRSRFSRFLNKKEHK